MSPHSIDMERFDDDGKLAPALIRPIGKLLGQGVQQKFLDPQLQALLALWEAELTRSAWFAGDAFSAADIQMSFPLLAAEMRHGLGDYPALQAALARIRERPAYQRTVAQIGEFSSPGR
nr:glutathione binding-like protein [Halomonas socia]